MNIYLAGTPVALSVVLRDRNGNALEVAAIEYRVVKQDGTEVVARSPLTGFDGGSEATIEIPADINAVAVLDPASITASMIDAFFVRESRTVELFCVDAGGNTLLLTETYVLEPAETLIAGLNSFQSFSQAELVAMDIPQLSGWGSANEKDKIAALIEARLQICQLRFDILNSNVSWGQDNLNYIPEGTYPTPYAGMFMFSGDLTLITPSNFVKLPPRFKMALCRAQVAQADAVLGGDPTDIRRKEGLILETIGEVKQMFRGGKPLDLPVSKRALKYLSPFVSFSKRIGRG
ncbi:MAG: hypothetical protein FWF12_00455 [Betaproteobacteria bacterium]|nr:hypothetical protein [Betaproteobacteria bacterium]